MYPVVHVVRAMDKTVAFPLSEVGATEGFAAEEWLDLTSF